GWGTGRPMGAAGAGLATFISVAAGVCAMAVYFMGKEKYVMFRVHGLGVRLNVWRRLLSIGLPSGGEFIMLGLYTLFVYWIIRDRGASAQAGFGVGVRLMSSLFMPVVAVSFAASPVAGQNFGARLGDRVYETLRVASIMSIGIMIAVTILCQIAP